MWNYRVHKPQVWRFSCWRRGEPCEPLRERQRIKHGACNGLWSSFPPFFSRSKDQWGAVQLMPEQGPPRLSATNRRPGSRTIIYFYICSCARHGGRRSLEFCCMLGNRRNKYSPRMHKYARTYYPVGSKLSLYFNSFRSLCAREEGNLDPRWTLEAPWKKDKHRAHFLYIIIYDGFVFWWLTAPRIKILLCTSFLVYASHFGTNIEHPVSCNCLSRSLEPHIIEEMMPLITRKHCTYSL